MKRLSITSLAFLLILVVSKTAIAAKSDSASSAPNSGSGSQAKNQVQIQTQPQLRVSPVATGSQVRNTNQIQAQNQGENTQVKTSNQERENFGSGSANAKKLSPRSETAREHMSVVAQRVEELLTSRTAKGGIGPQISEFAKQQKQSQEKVDEAIETVESRSGFAKLLLGPNFKALDKIEEQVEQNQQRIEVLQQLEAQVTNQADKTKLQETVQAVLQQNTALQELVNAEARVRSVFGWLVKLISR